MQFSKWSGDIRNIKNEIQFAHFDVTIRQFVEQNFKNFTLVGISSFFVEKTIKFAEHLQQSALLYALRQFRYSDFEFHEPGGLLRVNIFLIPPRNFEDNFGFS